MISNDYLKSFGSEIVFITLNEEVWKNSFQEMTMGTMIPVFTDDILGMASDDSQHFSTSQIVSAMLWILGMDSSFRFNNEYRGFLKKTIDDLESYALFLFQKCINSKYMRRGFFILRGLINEGYHSFLTYYNYAHSCKEMIAIEAKDEIKQFFYDESKLYFQKSLEENGDIGVSYYQLGYFAMQDGDFHLAVSYFTKAQKILDDEKMLSDIPIVLQQLNNDILIRDGKRALDHQKVNQAMEILLQVKNPTKLQKLNLSVYLGYCYRLLGDFEKSLENYEYSFLANNQDGHLLNEMALCYMGLKDTIQAEELLENAFELNPNSLEILCNLSLSQFKNKKIENALISVKKALAIDDKDEIALSCYEFIKKSLV